jgi:hypothetical protein
MHVSRISYHLHGSMGSCFVLLSKSLSAGLCNQQKVEQHQSDERLARPLQDAELMITTSADMGMK